MKIDSETNQPITSEGVDAVVNSDIVDVTRVSGVALYRIRKGEEKS